MMSLGLWLRRTIEEATGRRFDDGEPMRGRERTALAELDYDGPEPANRGEARRLMAGLRRKGRVWHPSTRLEVMKVT